MLQCLDLLWWCLAFADLEGLAEFMEHLTLRDPP